MKAKQLLLMFLVLLSIPPVQADKWVYGAAYQFETGDFSQPSNTDIVTVPVYLNYYTGSWGFGIEIPYVSVSGSSDIIISSNGQSIGKGKHQNSTATSGTSYTRAGIGDVTMFVSYAIPADESQKLYYELSTAVKLATADESENLGTGENDYSVSLNISSRIDHWSPALNIGYQITGDTSSTDLNDVFFYSVGSGYQMNGQSSIAINYNFKQALSDDSQDSSNIGLKYTHMLSRYYDIGLGLTSGINDQNADYGVSFFFTGYY